MRDEPTGHDNSDRHLRFLDEMCHKRCFVIKLQLDALKSHRHLEGGELRFLVSIVFQTLNPFLCSLASFLISLCIPLRNCKKAADTFLCASLKSHKRKTRRKISVEALYVAIFMLKLQGDRLE
jgi:hypothetical protein